MIFLSFMQVLMVCKITNAYAIAYGCDICVWGVRVYACPLHVANLEHAGILMFWMNFLNSTGCVSERLKVSSKC